MKDSDKGIKKGQATDWEKIYANKNLTKETDSKVNKELSKLNNNKQTTQLKRQAKDLDISQKW